LSEERKARPHRSLTLLAAGSLGLASGASELSNDD